MKRNRFQNGLDAQNGACNVRAIARGVRDGVAEARTEGASPAECPGIRLMLHQLSWLVFGSADPVTSGKGGECDAVLGRQVAEKMAAGCDDDFVEWAAQQLPDVADRAAESGLVEEDHNVATMVYALQVATIGAGSVAIWDGWDAAMDTCKTKTNVPA